MDLENSRRTPWVDQLVDIVDNVDMYVQPRVPQLPPARDKYPFARMEVGDSFFVEWPKTGKEKFLATARSLISRFGRTYGMRFATRALDEGVRVWRID